MMFSLRKFAAATAPCQLGIHGVVMGLAVEEQETLERGQSPLGSSTNLLSLVLTRANACSRRPFAPIAVLKPRPSSARFR